jgi:predicted phage terminase large subunit-like protein
MGYSVSEVAIVRAICRESFFRFVQEFWSVNIPQPPVWNWHIPYLCNIAQAAAERVMRGEAKLFDYIFNVPPGTTKSTILSVMFPAWVWTRMPEARFICASHTYLLALDLSRKSRDIIQSDKYQACFPEVKMREDQNTKGYFTNTASGMRYSIGVGGSVIGMHAHFLIPDDPIDPLSAISDEELLKSNRWCQETLPSRKVDKDIAIIMMIMQRLHQNDPAGAWLAKAKGNVKHICLPAEITDNVRPVSLRRHYVDGLLDPVRLSRRVLDETRVDLGEYGYACQFLQTPIPPGGGLFQVDKIIRVPPNQAPEHYDIEYRYWDKAGTEKGGDYTVGARGGRVYDPLMRRNGFWITAIHRGQWDSGTREREIMRIAAIDGRAVRIAVEQEPGSGGKESAEATASRLAGYRVKLVSNSGDKTQRADEFSSQVNSGNVYVVDGPWVDAFLEELKFFPYGTYDDQVDATSGLFSMLAAPRRVVGAIT